MQLIKIV